MNKLSLLRGGVAAVVLFTSASAHAADPMDSATAGIVTLEVGTGVTALHANEIVYLNEGPDTTELSHLFWSSVAPTLTGQLTVTLPEGWTLAARGQIAMSGDSFMSDYDWINPPNGDYSFDNWTDRSRHDNTELDWYFNGSVLVGRDLVIDDHMTVNINGGAKYTTVQWSAYDGQHIYSTDSPTGFRDDIGPSDEGHAITYTQRIPSLFAGIDATFVSDQWTFGVGAQAGLAFNVTTTDHHWRNRSDPTPHGTLFEDSFSPAPTISLSASADYAISDTMDFVVAGALDKFFLARGDEVGYDDITGDADTVSEDNEGTDLLAATATIGLKGKF